MKQIKNLLAVVLVLTLFPLGANSNTDDPPINKRMRIWSEIHAATIITKPTAYRWSTSASRSMREMPSMPSRSVREMPTMPGFAIQLGAFSEYQNARNLVVSLQDKGVQNVYYRKITVRNKVFHKVVVGPFRERTNATSRWTKISQNYGLKEGYVTSI